VIIVNPWEPIEQAVREVLAAREQDVTEENVQNICAIFVAHLMSGKDFRTTIEETVDDVLYRTSDYGGLAGLIVA
jgi:hypothetical protein